MKLNLVKMWIYALIAVFPVAAFGQKVRVGYEKGIDFLKFRSYTWAAPAMPVTRPLAYASVVGRVDEELKAKGLTKTEMDGDLVRIPAGGWNLGSIRQQAYPFSPLMIRLLGSEPLCPQT